MPFVSQKQARFFNANRGKLERQGVDVDEWNRATNFSALPERKMSTVDLGKKGSFHVEKGALHRMLHVSPDKPIGQAKIRRATHSSNPQLRRRAVSALGLTHMKHGG